MKKLLIPTVLMASLITGCSSVPTESDEVALKAKEFNLPSESKAGLYIFRKDTFKGAALKKDVFVDEKCIGETAKGVFFYHEVDGNQEHTVSTESEFSNNDLVITTEPGSLYFVEQYIKMGAFVGGAGLQEVDTEQGKNELTKLKMATKGNCNSTATNSESSKKSRRR